MEAGISLKSLGVKSDLKLAGRNYNPGGTFDPLTRNTLDLNAIPLIKRLSHLPVFVDPSHGTGIRDLVPAVRRNYLGADLFHRQFNRDRVTVVNA